MTDQRITKCCASIKHFVILWSDRAKARQSGKAIAFSDMHGGVSEKYKIIVKYAKSQEKRI